MRALGACAILFAAVSIGLLRLREKKRRLDCLRSLEEALRLMAGELSLRRPTMPELLCRMAEQSEGSAAGFFRCLALSMPRLGEKSFSALWTDAVRACFPELRREEENELRKVGHLLGRFELSQQLAGLESCRLRLRSRLERAEDAYQREKKLTLALPAAAGCLLILWML